MGSFEKAKFSVGDVVVNTLYGTVGMVTNIQEVDARFVYEVNHSEELYAENNLILFNDYEGEVFMAEKIEMDLPFAFGEIVNVKGQGTADFKIIGIRIEIWRYEEDGWEEVIFELENIVSKEMLEVSIEDMIPKTKLAVEELFSKELTWTRPLSLPAPVKKNEQKTMNQWLDEYNDYKMLYEWFQDESYKQAMNEIMQKLRGE